MTIFPPPFFPNPEIFLSQERKFSGWTRWTYCPVMESLFYSNGPIPAYRMSWSRKRKLPVGHRLLVAFISYVSILLICVGTARRLFAIIPLPSNFQLLLLHLEEEEEEEKKPASLRGIMGNKVAMAWWLKRDSRRFKS